MLSKRIRWLLVVVITGTFLLPVVGQAQQAQPNPGPGQVGKPPIQSTPGQPAPGQTLTERRPPAPEYAIALLSTLLVLVVVCMPSRKGVS